MKTLKDIGHLEGVKVLVRADFNVPIRKGAVADDFRILKVLPTLDFLTSRGAKVILVSHIEANEGAAEHPAKAENSLRPVATLLNKMGKKVLFIENPKNAYSTIENVVRNGECVLLENLRIHEGEKTNSMRFAEEMASLADIYVNEAFPVSHRSHASIVSVPKFLPSYAGLQLEREVAYLSKAFQPPHPFLFILGGAKFETKLPLIQKFLDTADTLFIGGALANDLLKAKGYEIGKSLVSGGDTDFAALVANPKIVLPIDVITRAKEIKDVDKLSPEDAILDAGPKTIQLLKERASQAKFILWNGPLGLYEEGFRDSTLQTAEIMTDATAKGAETVVGGGDTVAAIATLGMQDKISFISTGGGAMLDFLAKGTLPGIQALNA